MSESRCPFCGMSWYLDDPNCPENIGADLKEHIDSCRIHRFNRACDAALVGLIPHGLRTKEEALAGRVITYARALVEAIEKEQEK